MKWMAACAVVIYFLVMNPSVANATEVIPFTPIAELPPSPVIVTGYSIVNKKLEYVQIFNTSDKPVDLRNWAIDTLTSTGDITRVLSLKGLIAPANYLVISRDVSIGADFIDITPSGFGNGSPEELRLIPSDRFDLETIKFSKEGAYQRKISTSTGKYLSTFELRTTQVLYGGGFYSYPESTPLTFSEVLANPTKCSPLSEDVSCADYIKIYNPSTEPVDLALFRLRIGYKGQESTTSNTYQLVGLLQPGHYKVVSSDMDGRMVSVTNTGGYMWLEDSYGLKLYDNTIGQYADASSITREGQAWAYNVDTGRWEWTSTPTPWDAASRFPKLVEEVSGEAVTAQVTCPVGQVRNEETHRCRTLAATAVTTAKPCPAGQYRNPETNRCRVATVVEESKSCEPGYERNPETNRCRKVADTLGASDFKAESPANESKTFIGWWAMGGAGVLAVGYGVWEWRQEIIRLIQKTGGFFISNK